MIDALRRAAEVGRFCSIRGFETKVERTSDPESRNWSWQIIRTVPVYPDYEISQTTNYPEC